MPKRHKQPRFDASDGLLDSNPDSTIDLHGMRADEVRRTVGPFLENCARRRERHVHIITGKGRSSPTGAVLKPLVRGLLKGALSGLVADWCEDTAGGGYVVRLR